VDILSVPKIGLDRFIFDSKRREEKPFFFPKRKEMSPLIILLGIVLFIGIVMMIVRRKKSSSSSSGGGSGGAGKCQTIGQKCSSSQDCCDSLGCNSGICKSVNPALAMETFFLKTLDHKCLGLTNEGLIGVVSMDCNWTPGLIPNSFWFWDGVSNLILKAPERNVAGSVIDLVNYSILPPTGPGYVKISKNASSGVILTSAGNVYSSDYSLCLSLEEETEKLRWIECTGIPVQFSFEQPQHCSASKSKCSINAECCPPFGNCVNGQCSTCFGDPIQFQQKNCPGPMNYVVCGDNSSYKCKSQCDGMTKSCDEGSHSVCSIKPDGGYELICEVLCEGNAPKCENDIVRCKNTSSADDAPHYEWKCPIDYCKDPLSFPHADSAPAPNGYHRVGDHFEVIESIGNESWLYPEWECEKSTGGKWIYVKGCNLNVHHKCGIDTSAVCKGPKFEWDCQPNTGLDKCGVQSKPDCPDAICVDSVCGNIPGDANGWKWICPSSDQMSTCEAANYVGWFPSTAAGYGGTIYTDNVGNPVYPTINEEKCRSSLGTIADRPDFVKKVSNPKGTIGKNGYRPFPTYFTGNDDYIYTNYEYNGVEWKCPTKNPCGGNGTFTNSDGSPYQPITINPPAGNVNSPTIEEVLPKGKCVCKKGFAGNQCQYSNDKCNGGTIQGCNDTGDRCVDKQYSCVCPPDTYGKNCQFTRDNCNGHGFPNNNLDTLKCECDKGFGPPGVCTNVELGCKMGNIPAPASIPEGKYRIESEYGYPPQLICLGGYNGLSNNAVFGDCGNRMAGIITNDFITYKEQKIILSDGRVLMIGGDDCRLIFDTDYVGSPSRFIISYTHPNNVLIYSVDAKLYVRVGSIGLFLRPEFDEFKLVGL
jgi:hypothetical protein